ASVISAIVYTPSIRCRRVSRGEGTDGVSTSSIAIISTIAARSGRDQRKNSPSTIAPMTDPLGCERARSRTETINGLRLHFLESGPAGARPLCFLQGGAAHAPWFDAVTPFFEDRSHVVSLDQRGHGESQWAVPAAYGTEDFGADLRGLMDVLGRG